MDKNFDSLTLPLLAGLLAITVPIGFGIMIHRKLKKDLRDIPSKYGKLLRFERVETPDLPEWWVGKIEGRQVGITAVTAQLSDFNNRSSPVLILRLIVAIRPNQPLDYDFRYRFSRPIRPDQSIIFEKHANLSTTIKGGILEFLQSWSGLYVGRISKLHRDPPRQFQDVLAHDTRSTNLSIDELKNRIKALANLATAIEDSAQPDS